MVMRKTVLAVAMLVAGTAGAQEFYAPRVDVGPEVDRFGQFSTIRVTTADGRATVFRVDENGDVVLRYGAVVDFNGITFPRAGKREGFLMVMVDGEPKLIPLYGMPAKEVK